MTGTGYKSVSSKTAGASLIRPSIFRQVADFANVLKAFIGTNWIGLPFAFKQSGLVLGVVGLLLISFVTDHCCQLIIKCKKAAVQIVLDTVPECNDVESQELQITDLRNTVEKRMLFGEIGRIALGKWGLLVVNIALLATQYGFCIGYFIFLGNTIESMFPRVWRMEPAPTLATVPAHLNFSNHSSSSGRNSTSLASLVSTAPVFALLVLIPLFPLVCMSYIRSVRKLGPVSFAANIALLLAFLSVVGYMMSGLKFKVDEIKLVQVATFPVFFGQVTSAYEGIGTVVPIETSMAENRHKFPLYLHMAIGTVSVILGCFGVLGYLVYGEEVDQIVTESFPYGILIQVVRCLLCLAILLTYPLQIFPVIEIVEGWLFTSGNTKKQNNVDELQSGVQNEDYSYQTIETTETTSTAETSRLLQPDVKKPKSKVRMWKKNVLRTFIVLTTAGIAVALKNDFAYVNAIVGSLGSSTLGYILPCVFHLVLCKHSLTKLSVVKDVLLIVFGVVGGLVGVAVTVNEMV